MIFQTIGARSTADLDRLVTMFEACCIINDSIVHSQMGALTRCSDATLLYLFKNFLELSSLLKITLSP